MFWTQAPGGALTFRTWEHDEHVVMFNPVSGDTHLMDEFGMALLGLVSDAPRSPDALALQLSDYFQDVGSEGILQHVDATLRRFHQLGIVVPLSP